MDELTTVYVDITDLREPDMEEVASIAIRIPLLNEEEQPDDGEAREMFRRAARKAREAARVVEKEEFKKLTEIVVHMSLCMVSSTLATVTALVNLAFDLGIVADAALWLFSLITVLPLFTHMPPLIAAAVERIKKIRKEWE